jgi:hypothetical protein
LFAPVDFKFRFQFLNGFWVILVHKQLRRKHSTSEVGA